MVTATDEDRPRLRQRAAARIPALLRETQFRRYWTAQTISMFGDQISGIAIPLTAVLVLHASAADMGYLTALVWLPSLLFGLHAGAWVDRRGRRRATMIGADLGRFALLASLPACYALHVLTLGQLFAVAFGVGVLSVLFTVSDSALFVAVVPADRYLDGNSLIYSSRALSFVGGPSVGGLLVQALSAPAAIAADALSFLGSAFFLHRIRPAEPPAEPRRQGCRDRRREVHRQLADRPGVAPGSRDHQLLQPHVQCAVPALRGPRAAHQRRADRARPRRSRGRRRDRRCRHQADRRPDRRRLGLRGRVRAVHCAALARPARRRPEAADTRDAVRCRVPVRLRRDGAGHQRGLDLRGSHPGRGALQGGGRVPGGELRHQAGRRAARRRPRHADRAAARAVGGGGGRVLGFLVLLPSPLPAFKMPPGDS